MHPSVMEFGRRVLTPGRIEGSSVLEVGAYDVNGSLRHHVLSLGPADYLGIDIRDGPGVDRVLAAEDLPALGRCFDIVISTEMLEHAWAWRGALYGCKWATRVGGLLLLTTRAHGFPRHEHPGDWWRFSPQTLRRAMTGFRILELENDTEPGHPGVLLLARRNGNTIDVPKDIQPEPAP